MIALIAESKTMNSRLKSVSPEELAARLPENVALADEIAFYLTSMPDNELSARLNLGAKSALAAKRYLLDFHNKSTGMRAIDAFTGVVFKALDFDTLPESAATFAAKRLRIISSIYGIVAPDDIIKPYRLDYNLKAAPDGSPLASYIREAATQALSELLRMQEDSFILNLLPEAAMKCFDWKRIDVPSLKIDFLEMKSEGKLTTPHSNRLKTLRGKFLRDVLIKNIDTYAGLISADFNDFMLEGSYPGRLVYITA